MAYASKQTNQSSVPYIQRLLLSSFFHVVPCLFLQQQPNQLNWQIKLAHKKHEVRAWLSQWRPYKHPDVRNSFSRAHAFRERLETGFCGFKQPEKTEQLTVATCAMNKKNGAKPTTERHTRTKSKVQGQGCFFLAFSILRRPGRQLSQPGKSKFLSSVQHDDAAADGMDTGRTSGWCAPLWLSGSCRYTRDPTSESHATQSNPPASPQVRAQHQQANTSHHQ